MISSLSYLYYKVRCVFVCGHSNVPTLTSPPVLKLWGTQGYLWLFHDLTEVIKLDGERFKPKQYFFQRNTLCHSFHIIVIPSVLLSFLPDFCHSFQVIVILSGFVSFLPNIVILSEVLPFQIFVILNSSSTLDSEINVAPVINVAPGTFGKNIKRSP